jgi:hypothetical protein
MPLRPVSELGLVDITDVPTRKANRTADAAQPSARVKSRSTPAPERRARSESRPASRPKRASTGPAPAENSSVKSNRVRSSTRTSPGNTSDRGSARKRGNGAPVRSDQDKAADARTRSRNKPASQTTSSERSRGRSKAARDDGSGGATSTAAARSRKQTDRSASPPRRARTVRQQASAESRSDGNHGSRENRRPRNRSGRAATQVSPSAKVGVYVLMGASLVAGGLLVARAALHH